MQGAAWRAPAETARAVGVAVPMTLVFPTEAQVGVVVWVCGCEWGGGVVLRLLVAPHPAPAAAA